jgi:hypothetical protein
MVRSIYEVKPFRLVFCLEIWGSDWEDAAERLKRHIDAEAARGRLEFVPCPPVIVFDTRATRSPYWRLRRVWGALDT